MKNFIQPGKNLTFTAPSGGVTAGNLVAMGAIVGVADRTAVEGAEFVLVVEGVFEVAKATSEVWSVGDVVYLDESEKEATKTSTDNVVAGHAVAAAVSDATSGLVRISF